MDKRPLGKRIKYSALYYFIRLLILLSWWTPRPLWLWFCGRLGALSFYILKDTRRRALESLTTAYGNEKSREEIFRIRKRMFAMLGKNAGDIVRARNVETLAQLEKFMDFDGYENFTTAASKGRGVIFVACHLGAFDLEVNVMSLRGWRPNVIGTALKDPRLNDLLFNYRNRLGAIPIERGKETLRMLRALKKGEMIAILIDQDTKVKSCFVDFYGKPASTPVGAALLALKTGAAVVPTSIYLGDDGRQHMQIYPEIPLVQTGNDELDIITNTQVYTSFIEARIREHPDQWVWMHERWKTQQQSEATIS